MWRTISTNLLSVMVYFSRPSPSPLQYLRERYRTSVGKRATKREREREGGKRERECERARDRAGEREREREKLFF